MITPNDLPLLAEKGILEAQINEQLSRFRHGFPFLKLDAAASVDRGILKLNRRQEDEYIDAWEAYTQTGNPTVVKFVPASGAASRMFKELFEYVKGDASAPETPYLKTFFDRIREFAFYDDLNATTFDRYERTVSEMMEDGDHKLVAACLLDTPGLNYGKLPKGLLKFHKYTDEERTPVEEHLVEAALYATTRSKQANIHFTVSAEHRQLFRELIDRKANDYAERYGTTFNVSFSEQKPSTDTIAADAGNQPFREEGKLLFRPGGHGALIENLNDLEADVVFIKNIDNVVPDRLKPDTTRYKKLIAGVLVSLQQQCFRYLELLDSGQYTQDQVLEIVRFVQKQFCCKNPETKLLEDVELVLYLKGKLNRPIRVCGMVQNVGEPGGGPFLAYNADGTISPQILESSQIDMNDPEKKKMFENGTHFNPVDLVCAVRDYQGNPFDLTRYVDPDTGFISSKSKDGRELKALELPGLWNGAMSDWNTVFVEVPLSTFNPVKTVLDLLREEHR